jgi:ubiquinone biosynthesis protein
VEIQPQLMLLQKTLLHIEGLGRQLYPELDVWKTASPILREWMRDRMSGRTVIESLRAQLPELIEAARALPPLVKGAMQRAHDGTLRLQVEAHNIDSLKAAIREGNRRRDRITVAALVLLGGIVWLAVRGDPLWAGWALLGGGSFGVLWGAKR